MIRLLVSTVLLLAATAPLAARPSTLGMSCRQAQNLVATQGAVVMTTGQHTYARFVAHPGLVRGRRMGRRGERPRRRIRDAVRSAIPAPARRQSGTTTIAATDWFFGR